ncbi:hypothetical protein NST54_15300 [Caldifermentibacillus hisashii]|uniref:Uncharacterized protein n=1 Tax=Caldibacillus thermoamylovorans TaxID=35841 RepID=A0A0D0FIF5_9BACI|nr:hypothetical protein [Caldibacillus thermoamylovorans]AWI13405.1 hypothetical protein CQJ30_15360 [Caldibacillus thermoamylovorans]KIO58573.1 hypothetical protein B4065_3711 [Caldibacillus thermoamylovorans]KIO62375.1 hypothetical protein B4166_3378 [Caldibacillus thermoamylovorans]KIO71864.1 hypothetical protein B4167_3267 [Caldibacillus thermoamylovorans]
MKKKLLGLYIKMMHPVKNEKGAQSLEWLGLAALLILVLGLISQAVSNEEESIGKVIQKIIQKITKMVGD